METSTRDGPFGGERGGVAQTMGTGEGREREKGVQNQNQGGRPNGSS